MRGTWLNVTTVVVGGTVGTFAGRAVPTDLQSMVLSSLGFVSLGLGIKLFLPSKNILLVAAALALGGVLGYLLRIDAGLGQVADLLRQTFGGSGRFNEAVVTASILFCVGPMTILGCIEDGLKGKSELLGVKSTLDGFAAFFLAATLGPGIIASALVVLVVQGALSLGAHRLAGLAEDDEMIGEVSAVGGLMMLGIGLGLLDLKKVPTANFLPALFLAPLFLVLSRRFGRRMA
jgi:uncharacterized membrane protein YqgA involved in biofilm formation